MDSLPRELRPMKGRTKVMRRVGLFARGAFSPYKIYQSVHEACEKQGMTYANAMEIIKAKRRSIDGIRWRFLD